MNDERFDELMMELRDSYNRPPDTPREEMWAAIRARLGSEDGQGAKEDGGLESGDGKVISIQKARRFRPTRIPGPLAWIVAAAAMLVLGLGIGRMTAPGTAPGTGETLARALPADPAVLRAAAVEHLVRTESLLTLVRADARVGRVEPTVGSWARQLLSQTRLLMDAQPDSDPVMEDLLRDLELVLVQILGMASASPEDRTRVQSELNLVLEGLEEREVLSRIQAVVPAGPGRYGT